MKIGIVIPDLDRSRGGLSQWCWQFVDAVAQRGHEVHIVTQQLGDEALPARVESHLIAKSKSRMIFAQTAAQRVQGLQLDVVHDMGGGWHCDVFQPHGGSHLAWLERKSHMVPGWFQAIKKPIDAMLPRHRDFVRHCRRQFSLAEQREKTFVALSKTVAEEFVRFHQIRPEQIAVVYNGVDCRRFTPDNRELHREPLRQTLGLDRETLLLLLAAHNFRLKGLIELIEVTHRLVTNRRRVHLAVVGGKHLAKWRRLIERRGLSDRVTFVGPVRDLVPYYAAADAYAQPTYYDPCSLVLLEAAASGLPIVTTRRHNGAAELFRDGQEILMVNNPYEIDALYERIDALFDQGLRQKLGGGAREVALRNTFEGNVANILQRYQRHDRRRLAA